MAWEQNFENKAGWNASQEIIQTLSNLRNTYLSAMMDDNLIESLAVIRRILDVICGKVDKKTEESLNNRIYEIEDALPKSEQKYHYNGMQLFKDPIYRKEIKRKVEAIYRELELLQDKKGYGMIAAADPRLAVSMER